MHLVVEDKDYHKGPHCLRTQVQKHDCTVDTCTYCQCRMLHMVCLQQTIKTGFPEFPEFSLIPNMTRFTFDGIKITIRKNRPSQDQCHNSVLLSVQK